MSNVIELFPNKPQPRPRPRPTKRPIGGDDFAERMVRIKESIARINSLMAELKEDKDA